MRQLRLRKAHSRASRSECEERCVCAGPNSRVSSQIVSFHLKILQILFLNLLPAKHWAMFLQWLLCCVPSDADALHALRRTQPAKATWLRKC